jgi:hypothetical protein
MGDCSSLSKTKEFVESGGTVVGFVDLKPNCF